MKAGGKPTLLLRHLEGLGDAEAGDNLAYDVDDQRENGMPRAKKQSKDSRSFINVAVSNETRAGLHILKDAMGVAGQAEVIEKLVVIGLAIHLATR